MVPPLPSEDVWAVVKIQKIYADVAKTTIQ